MYRFQQSIQNRQNTYTMEHEKGGGFLLGWKVFPLSKRLYLSLRDAHQGKQSWISVICWLGNPLLLNNLLAFATRKHINQSYAEHFLFGRLWIL